MLIKFSFTACVRWHSVQFIKLCQTNSFLQKSPAKIDFFFTLYIDISLMLLLLLWNVSWIKIKTLLRKKLLNNVANKDFWWNPVLSARTAERHTKSSVLLFYSSFTTCWFHGNCWQYDSPAGKVSSCRRRLYSMKKVVHLEKKALEFFRIVLKRRSVMRKILKRREQSRWHNLILETLSLLKTLWYFLMNHVVYFHPFAKFSTSFFYFL